MKNYYLTLVLGLFCFAGIQAQSLDELKSMKADKEATIAALQAEVDGIDNQIYTFPGWKFGGVGVAGFNLLANNNWFALGAPNSKNNALSIGLGAYANLDVEKYFWRNLLDVSVARSENFVDKDLNTTKSVALTNGLTLSSLFGYKLTPKLALSAEGRWTSTILELDPGNVLDFSDDAYSIAFNAPGQLTVSAGLTWLPINNLVVLIHPLGYQQNWPGELTSSAGAKIGATYAAEIVKNVSWSSNLSAFIPYGGAGDAELIKGNAASIVGYDTGELVNWEWVNGFSTSIFRGLGVAFNIGLKQNKQQADLGRLSAASLAGDITQAVTSDSPLQSYYTLGLGYTF